jgi:hypothetical protein
LYNTRNKNIGFKAAAAVLAAVVTAVFSFVVVVAVAECANLKTQAR